MTNTVRRGENSQFSLVPQANIPRSSFDRSSGWKGTFNAGKLVPFFADEVLPGDTFNLHATILTRLATPIVPFMDNVYIDTHFFFIPNRLVWDHWQRFCGEQINPGDSIDFLVPQDKAPAGGWQVGGFYDALGLPTGLAGISACAFYRRSAELVWNEFFRDQNLENAITVDKGDNGKTHDPELLPRAKFHDYFTSCLPWPQRGSAAMISIGGTAPVTIPGGQISGEFGGKPQIYFGSSVSAPTNVYALGAQISTNSAQPKTILASTTSASLWETGESSRQLQGIKGTFFHEGFTGTADMSNIAPITVNSLREAFQIQKLLEASARGGCRYAEQLHAMYGVISPDARLQRPEYLGGGSSRINVNTVQQTSASDDVTPQGNLAAFAVGLSDYHGFTKSFTEHGVIIGFVSVRADLTYQQGINRMFSRRSRFDYYYPVLAHLGEQAVLNKEIYAQNTEDDDKVFGYQERWAEYRYKPSLITGKLRSTSATPLDCWHLAQKFDSLPTLSADFIHENPPIERVVATTNEPHFLCDAWFDLKCVRPMPVYSTPGLVDHF